MRYAIVLLALLLAAVPPAAAQAQPQWPADDTLPIGQDWIQIESGEWLKGKLLAMYDDDLEFDSDEFGVKTYDWKDVKQVRTARTMTVGLTDGEAVVGKLALAGETVRIFGDERREVQRSQVLSISPSGGKPLSRWGGKISAGLTARKGNVDQLDTNVSAYLKHRRVHDLLALDYLANYSANQGSGTANNQRVQGHWDHFITDRVFVKPVILEWYRDPFQNLDARASAGAAAGYRIFNTRRTEWQVSAGLAYQQTRWVAVEAGQDARQSAGAFAASMSFEQEWTKAVDFKFDYTFYLTQESAGRYIHHLLVSVETDWTKNLDLDVSVSWDRTQIPQATPGGAVPDQDDLRMVVGLGFKF